MGRDCINIDKNDASSDTCDRVELVMDANLLTRAVVAKGTLGITTSARNSYAGQSYFLLLPPKCARRHHHSPNPRRGVLCTNSDTNSQARKLLGNKVVCAFVFPVHIVTVE